MTVHSAPWATALRDCWSRTRRYQPRWSGFTSASVQTPRWDGHLALDLSCGLFNGAAGPTIRVSFTVRDKSEMRRARNVQLR